MFERIELSSGSLTPELLLAFKVLLYEIPEPGNPALPVNLPSAERETFIPLGPADIPRPFFETFKLNPGANVTLLRN